jgi:ABC-2 type transport system permease protein
VRQPGRVAGTVGTPLLFWGFLAAGASGSFAPAGGEATPFSAFLLPGIITMTVMFSVVFSAISLIQDRQAGFLQGVIVSSAPSWVIVGSKVAGGVVIGAMQGGLLLISGAAALSWPGVVGILAALGAIALVCTAVVSLGLALAWRSDSIAGFHNVMTLLLMPMWLLSGSLFPVEGASTWLALVMNANPLTWATQCIAGPLGVGEAQAWHWVATATFALAAFAWAAIVMSKRSTSVGAAGER